MSSTSLCLAFILCCGVCIQIRGQTCRPTNVQNLTLNEDLSLTWTPSADENCSISFYIVYIHGGLTTEYVYMVDDPIVDVSHLPACESFRFTVVAVSSDNIEGPDRLLFDRMPLPKDANLTLDIVTVDGFNRGTYLKWQMEEEWEECAERFRVIVEDEDDDTIMDIYTTNMSINVTNLIPCTSYRFGVVALYNIVEEGPLSIVSSKLPEEPLSPPTLEDIKLGSTTADLTWRLDSYTENRCAVSALNIASSNFNISQEIVDQPERLPVSLNLTDLRPDSIYILNVTAVNTAGSSPSTLVAIQTLNNN